MRTNQGVIAIGGHNSYRKEPQKSTEIFTRSQGVWLPGPRMREARFGHQAIEHNNIVYVFGGSTDPRNYYQNVSEFLCQFFKFLYSI